MQPPTGRSAEPVRPDPAELLAAARAGDLAKVKQLVEAGADVNARDENKATALMWAAWSGSLDLVKYLVAKGAGPKRKGVIWMSEKKTGWWGGLMALAADRGRLDMLAYLLDELRLPVDDVEVDKEGNETGDTALLHATSKPNVEMIRLLLAHGASVNLANPGSGHTPLMRAAASGSVEAVQALLQAGADVNAIAKDGYTPLLMAADQRKAGVIPILIQAGAKVNDRDGNGHTALYWAAAYGSYSMILDLVDAGAAVEGGLKTIAAVAKALRQGGRFAEAVRLLEGTISRNASGYYRRVLGGELSSVQRDWAVSLEEKGLKGEAEVHFKLAKSSESRSTFLGVQKGHTFSITSVAFSPDGRLALSGSWGNTLKLWEVASGREVRTFQGHTGPINSVAFSPDGRLALSGGDDRTLKLWEVASGYELHSCESDMGEVRSVAFSPDGRFALAGCADGTLRLWEASSGRELCAMVSFDDGTWAVVDPEGRYDASNGGDVAGLHWVAGNETIELWQLKERFYDPGLLAKITGFNKEPLRPVESFEKVDLFPDIRLAAPEKGSTKLQVTLTNRGGGIGKVWVLVNGKEVTAEARGPKPDSTVAQAELTVDLGGAAGVVPGRSNTVEVFAWNAEGYLSSRGAVAVWVPEGEAPVEPPELYAIVGGISEYSSPALSLKYAAKDARDFASALRLGADRLFEAQRVHLWLLADGADAKGGPGSGEKGRLEADAPGEVTQMAPTKANFAAAFEGARHSKPGDVLVVYLAGHGTTVQGEKDSYVYLTREARSTGGAALADPAVRAATAVTGEELTEWVKRVPALKQVMVLDTCAAGAAATKLVEKRDVPSDQIRALERLKDRTGFHVLMGSAADAVSYEATAYGQGLLTYALLRGMKGAALRDDEYVDVSKKLFQYAADAVPELARDIGGVQRPQIAAPRGASFDVGRLTGGDKEAVPLAAARPMVLKPMFMDRDEMVDALGLTPALKRKLSEMEGSSALGGTVVFVDADELPGAVRPTGGYTVEGEAVKVTVNLVRDGKKLATFAVEGVKGDVPALAARIAEAVARAASEFAFRPPNP